MKKSILYTLLFIIVLHYTHGQKPENKIDLSKVFSYASSTIDVLTGNDFVSPELYTNLQNRMHIDSLKVTRLIIEPKPGSRYMKDDEIQWNYELKNGLIISEHYSDADVNPNRVYEYDEYNRLISVLPDYTYEYRDINSAQKVEQDYFFRGDYMSHKKAREIESGFEILSYYQGDYTTSEKYIYDNGVISKFIESNKFGSNDWDEWSWWTFLYDNNVITKIVNEYKLNDTIYSQTKTIEYDGSNMTCIENVIFDRQGKHTETWLFLDYDKFGNWEKAEIYEDGILMESYHRVIEYEK